MGDDDSSRRPLLTFRLDRELRQRLRSRLADDGSTLTDVVTAGLRRYVERADALAGQAAQPVARGARRAASSADLRLPDDAADYLRRLREGGDGELLSAALATMYDRGWPLRPLAEALGISRQAVQARIRGPVGEAARNRVADCVPPPHFPRRRPAAPDGRRPHLTIKIDQALRAAAHRTAGEDGTSVSQVVENIVHRYLRHGAPGGEVELGDTTPTGPALRTRRARRIARRDADRPGSDPDPG